MQVNLYLSLSYLLVQSIIFISRIINQDGAYPTSGSKEEKAHYSN